VKKYKLNTEVRKKTSKKRYIYSNSSGMNYHSVLMLCKTKHVEERDKENTGRGKYLPKRKCETR